MSSLDDTREKFVNETFKGIMAQVRDLCPHTDFREVGPFHRIVNGQIEDLPIEEDVKKVDTGAENTST